MCIEKVTQSKNWASLIAQLVKNPPGKQATRCTVKTILMFSGTPLVGLELFYTFQKTADFQFWVIFNV